VAARIAAQATRRKTRRQLLKTSITFLGNLDAWVSDKLSFDQNRIWDTFRFIGSRKFKLQTKKSCRGRTRDDCIFRATETRLPRELGMRLPAAHHVLLCNRSSLSTTRCPPGAPAAQCSWPADRPDDASAYTIHSTEGIDATAARHAQYLL
jgi:hypothetical protein